MPDSQHTHLRSRWIYLRILGVLYAVSFFSLSSQIVGLIGPSGVFPAQEPLRAAAHRAPSLVGRLVSAPTVFWIDAGPWALRAVCWIGLCGAIAVILNRVPRLGLALCWACFLSFVAVAPQFAWYASDHLLLEATVLAILAAPSGLRPGLGHDSPPSRASIFLYRWLLFRVMLETGMSKVFSGDTAWSSLRALDFFFETSPFPTWIAWFAHKLPEWLHRLMTGYVLFAEVGCSVLLFLGRRLTLFALGAWTLLQTSILLSGNFNTFNYHSIALAIFLVDDATWLRMRRLPSVSAAPLPDDGGRSKSAKRLALAFPCLLFAITLLMTLEFFGVSTRRFPAPLPAVLDATRGFRSSNSYILYPTIPRQRRVISFEGSNDGGKTWRPYVFRYQTQRVDKRPRFIAPLSPRFDREASRPVDSEPPLPYTQAPFVLRTARRLLEVEPSVVALFASDPFPDGRPDMIRTLLYRYRFSDYSTLVQTGSWWTRETVGEYSPMIVRDPATNTIGYVDPQEHR